MTKQDFINNFKNDKELKKKLSYLAERWSDEKEYEDINDYLKELQKSIPQSYRITKRPFSVFCKFDDGELQVGVKMERNYLTIFIR